MMKYKRLTTKDEEGNWTIWEDDYSHPFEALQVAIERLAELEDGLESGKIIRLPCAVDSEIYVIDYLTDSEDKKHYYIRKSTFHPSWIDEWRNMFCLTREEAEKRLKELQNE